MSADGLASLKIDRTQRRSRGLPWKWIIVALLVAAGIAAAPQLSKFQQVEVVVAPVITLRGGALASSKPGEGEMTAAGYIVADHQSVLAFKGTGRLTKLNVVEAQLVKKGENIAEIDHHELDAQIAQAEVAVLQAAAETNRQRKLAAQALAEIESAKIPERTLDAGIEELKIRVADANRRLKMTRDVAETNAMPASQIDDRITEVKAAEAQIVTTESHKAEARDKVKIAEMQAQVAQAAIGVSEANEKAAVATVNVLKAQLEDAFVYSPFDGVVTEKAAEVGEIVAPISIGGSMARGSIVTIAERNSLQAEVDVAESYIDRVKPGQRAAITVDAFPTRALMARRNRSFLAAALFFAGTLFPALGFINVYPFRYSWVADHFQYLACIGIIVPVAWLLSGLEKRALSVAAAILIAGLGAMTWHQAHMYTDPATLYLTTLQKNPSCWMADNNLAILLTKVPARRDEAIRYIRTAIQIKPNYHEAWNNLGSVLSDIPGRQAEAMDDFRMALRIKSDYPEALFNLGNEYYKIPGHLADAIAEYRAAIKAKPGFSPAHGNLGAILVKDTAHQQEGLDELEKAVKLDPAFIEARRNLAIALIALPGHAMEAQIEYEEIIRQAPRLATARVDLGYLLLKNPDGLADAVDQFRAAVALAPRAPETHVGLAVALFRVPGKSDEAVRHLEIALKLRPDMAVARQMLEVANAGIGK